MRFTKVHAMSFGCAFRSKASPMISSLGGVSYGKDEDWNGTQVAGHGSLEPMDIGRA